MFHASARPRRTQWIALAGAALIIALAFALLQGQANARSVSSAAANPNVSALVVSPQKPIKGKGFKVSFKTTSGGQYTVFEATTTSGGPLVSGSTGAGKLTTKTIGKNLSAGTYTIGVDLTSNNKTKRITKKVVIAAHAARRHRTRTTPRFAG